MNEGDSALLIAAMLEGKLRHSTYFMEQFPFDIRVHSIWRAVTVAEALGYLRFGNFHHNSGG